MRIVSNVTCLGCGCTCDDITVTADDNRIVEARHACGMGETWFGDGSAPGLVLADGDDVGMDVALDAAAALLAGAARPLVYLAPELSCEAQREAVAIADAVRARLDSVTTATILPTVLAQQERGRAAATLGEVRNRADLVVFWGVDPAARYPRYAERYAPDPPGLHVPDGRRSRTVVAVDIGNARGPADADLRVSFAAADEVAALSMMTAAVSEVGLKPDFDAPVRLKRDSDAQVRRKPDPTSSADDVGSGFSRSGSDVGSGFSRSGIGLLLDTLLAARYAVVVADPEPGAAKENRDAGRAAALVALTQALNGRTRCALSLLRAGGNRSGADAVMTWQTGYPTAVDFWRGAPVYRPYAASADGFDVVLIAGVGSEIPAALLEATAHIPLIVIGPQASEVGLPHARVAVDTAIAGIHEGGTAFRMDDVPVPLRPSLEGPPAAAAVLADLRRRLAAYPRLAAIAG